MENKVAGKICKKKPGDDEDADIRRHFQENLNA